MSIFTELKQQLSKQLELLAENSGLVELRAEVELSQNANLLAWLKAQTQFPQHFWQSRDQDLTFATVGAVREFDDLDQAQTFSQQYGFRLFGGLKFEGQCRFVLPRIAFAKNGADLTACCYLDAADRADFVQVLAGLDKIATLDLQANSLISQQSANDFTCWQHRIDDALSAITQGQFRKVVLANATTLTFEQPISPYDLLAASQQKNLGCYHFLWAENGDEAFVGSSPERLYQRQDRQFETEALAGTVAVSDDPIETERNGIWLLSDQKNIEENQYVVDDIHSHLNGSVCEFQVQPAQLKRLHNVQHLRRQIHATLNEKVSDIDCLARIHPTAAVAGLPRAAALQFIEQNEDFTRGWYAGALGYFSPEQAEFCVGLRSAYIQARQITLYAGAGIVAGSSALSEWREIEKKALAMSSLLSEK